MEIHFIVRSKKKIDNVEEFKKVIIGKITDIICDHYWLKREKFDFSVFCKEEDIKSKSQYKAILFAEDGEFMTDFKSFTKEEVLLKLKNKNQFYDLYPIEAVIKHHPDTQEVVFSKFSFSDNINRILEQKILMITPEFRTFKGRKVKTLVNFLKNKKSKL